MSGARSKADPASKGQAPIAKAACRSCGSENVAAFCADCGHAQQRVRRTVFQLVEDIANSLVKGDTRTLRALSLLITQPGELSQRRYEGKAAGLVSPVKLFFAVLVFYTLFFAVSPIKFAQLWIGLHEELPGGEVVMVGPGEMPAYWVLAEIFVPERELAITDQLQRVIEDAVEAGQDDFLYVDSPSAVFLRLSQSAARQKDAMGLTTLFLSYAPLLVMVPVVVLNGLLYRRRRYVVDHINFSFEVASIMPLALITGALMVLALTSLGFPAPGSPDFSPVFLFGVVPAFGIGIAIADRRYYRTPYWALLPKTALVVLGWYHLTEQATYFLLITAIEQVLA